MKRTFAALAIAASAAITQASAANAAIVTNGDFENPNVGTGGFIGQEGATTAAADTSIPSWGATYSGTGYFRYGVHGPGDGNFTGGTGQSGYINNVPNAASATAVNSIYQDEGSLLPNTTYTLTLELGNRSDFGNVPELSASYSLINGTDATGTVLATASDGPISNPSTANLSYVTPLTFTTGATVSGDLTIAIANTSISSTDGNYSQLLIDNVGLTTAAASAPTPEPASLSLLGLGAASLLGRRRKA